MGLSWGKVLSILLKSFIRDLVYLVGVFVFPAAISLLINLVGEGFLPWPMLLFLSLCDASAISAWLGGVKRSHLIVSSPTASITTAVTAMGFVIWTARALVLGIMRMVALGVGSITTLEFSALLLSCATGLSLCSLFLLLDAISESKVPCALVLSVFLVALLLGASVWVSELFADPRWRYVMWFGSDPIVASGTSLSLLVLSAALNLSSIWISRAKAVRASIDLQ